MFPQEPKGQPEGSSTQRITPSKSGSPHVTQARAQAQRVKLETQKRKEQGHSAIFGLTPKLQRSQLPERLKTICRTMKAAIIVPRRSNGTRRPWG
jgi:hypothetical protein